MKYIGIVLIFTITWSILSPASTEESSGTTVTCAMLDCDVCCQPSVPAVCVNDTTALDCEMRRDSDLDQLALILLVLLGFLIGNHLNTIFISNLTLAYYRSPIITFYLQQLNHEETFCLLNECVRVYSELLLLLYMR